MHHTWDNSATRELAQVAAHLWGMEVVRHISDSGNSVWLVQRDALNYVLRLSDPLYRTPQESEAELAFVRHLSKTGMRVASPLPSATSGAWVEKVGQGTSNWLASCFTFAPGEQVQSDSEHWGGSLLRAWGGVLGKLHAAARTYDPPTHLRRWEWKDDFFLRHALENIDPGDSTLLKCRAQLYATLESLSKSEQTYGMTHGDFAPQNFNFHPDLGITAFDFGNCCYHWYISDIAISITQIAHLKDFPSLRNELFTGYREHFELPDESIAQIPLFIHLRRFYAYMSRLMKFGQHPREEEKRVLKEMRSTFLNQPNE